MQLDFLDIKSENAELKLKLGKLLAACSAWLQEVYQADHWQDYYVAMWDSVFRYISNRERVFTIEDEANDPIAMIAISDIYPPYYFTTGVRNQLDLTQKALYINTLAVHPDHHGKGLARQLLDKIEAWASQEGYDCLRLDTLDEIEQIVSIYTRRGFIRLVGFGDDNQYGVYEKKLAEA